MEKEFEMTEQQLKNLMDACKPVPYIAVAGGQGPASPQANANNAWKSLGKELGFDWETVKPINGKGPRFFLAKEIENKLSVFQSLAKPLIKYLNDNHQPHTHIIITPTDAEISEGIGAFRTEEFLRD